MVFVVQYSTTYEVEYAADLLRYWRPESSCTTVALHETLHEVAAHREHRWDCVEEAT